MKTIAIVMVIAGATLALADYVVTNGSTPPSSAASLIVDIDDLNGALSGVAPYVGVGTALLAGGILLMVTA